MTTLGRIWIALAALGAGLLHLAVAAGAATALIVPFALLGAAELVWAGATLMLGRFPVRRIALTGSMLALVMWAGAVLASRNLGATVDNLPPMPLAIASLLDIVIAITIAVSIRRSPAVRREASPEPNAWLMVGGLLVGAFLVAGLTLPALGQTQAGIAALSGPHAHHATEFNIPDGGHAGH